jgi:hypothetical protein
MCLRSYLDVLSRWEVCYDMKPQRCVNSLGRDPRRRISMSSPKHIPIVLSQKDIARFLAKLPDLNESGCRPWMGCANPKGYGLFEAEHKQYLAHRVAWAIERGDPGDMSVLHSCDNPPCCNVDCLFLGTQLDNVSDMVSKGRKITRRGLENYNARFTESQVREIRERHANGERQTALSELFGVAQSTINRIVHRQAYSLVD